MLTEILQLISPKRICNLTHHCHRHSFIRKWKSVPVAQVKTNKTLKNINKKQFGIIIDIFFHTLPPIHQQMSTGPNHYHLSCEEIAFYFFVCFVIAFNFVPREKPDLSCLTLNFFVPMISILLKGGKNPISSQQVPSRAISSSSLYFLFHPYKSPSESLHWRQTYLSTVLEKIRKFCGVFLFAAISSALRKLPEI